MNILVWQKLVAAVTAAAATDKKTETRNTRKNYNSEKSFIYLSTFKFKFSEDYYMCSTPEKL